MLNGVSITEQFHGCRYSGRTREANIMSPDTVSGNSHHNVRDGNYEGPWLFTQLLLLRGRSSFSWDHVNTDKADLFPFLIFSTNFTRQPRLSNFIARRSLESSRVLLPPYCSYYYSKICVELFLRAHTSWRGAKLTC